MKSGRWLQAVVASGALISPLAAFADTVTTVPFIQAAPALTMPMLVAVAVVLLGVGAYCTRTRAGRAVAGLALVAGLSLLASRSYAPLPVVTVEGADCGRVTTQSYSNFSETLLTSLCTNRIKIVAIESDCIHGEALVTPPLCAVGQVLSNGDSCTLPSCPD